MAEELTGDEREFLHAAAAVTGPKAIRIIDAHAADRATIVAQLAELTRERDDLDFAGQANVRAWRAELGAASAELQQQAERIEQLTRERDEAQSELEAAEWKLEIEHTDAMQQRNWREAAEAQVRELEAKREPLAIDLAKSLGKAKAECADRVEEECRRKHNAEARVRELEERDAQRDHAWSVDVGHLRRAESECAAMRVENQYLRDIEDGQRTRVEKAEAECATLHAELADSRKFWAESKELEINARLAVESECAALRAKLIDREEKFVAKHAQLVAAESRLAAANALLGEARRALDDMLDRYQAQGLTSIKAQASAERIRGHLDNQPAAPCEHAGELIIDRATGEESCSDCQLGRAEVERGGFKTTELLQCSKCAGLWPAHSMVAARIEAEQRVLDAMAKVRISRMGLDGVPYIQSDGKHTVAAEAELARREAKKQDKED